MTRVTCAQQVTLVDVHATRGHDAATVARPCSARISDTRGELRTLLRPVSRCHPQAGVHKKMRADSGTAGPCPQDEAHEVENIVLGADTVHTGTPRVVIDAGKGPVTCWWHCRARDKVDPCS